MHQDVIYDFMADLTGIGDRSVRESSWFDRFWMDQDVKYDFTADLTGTGDRSVNVITET